MGLADGLSSSGCPDFKGRRASTDDNRMATKRRGGDNAMRMPMKTERGKERNDARGRRRVTSDRGQGMAYK